VDVRECGARIVDAEERAYPSQEFMRFPHNLIEKHNQKILGRNVTSENLDPRRVIGVAAQRRPRKALGMGETLQLTPLILHSQMGPISFDRVSQQEDDLEIRLKTKHVLDGFIRKPGEIRRYFSAHHILGAGLNS